MKLCQILSLFLILCGNINGSVLSDNVNVSVGQQVDSTLIGRQIHLVTSGFSSVFWDYIISSRDSLNNVSDQCSSHLNKLVESSLKGHPLAFKFLSLSGSRPNNFLDGNYVAFGSYDTCLSMSVFDNDKNDQTVKGQYCLTSFEPDSTRNGQIIGQLYPHYFESKYNFTIKVGFCVPSVCSQNDVQQILTQAFNDYSWSLVHIHSCEVKSDFFESLMSASKGEQILFWLLLGLVKIVFLGTFMDLKYSSFSHEKSSLFWIHQFSAIKSVKSLFRKTYPESRILVVDNYRLLTFSIVFSTHAIMWVVIINSIFLVEDHQYIKSLTSKSLLQPIMDDWLTQALFYLGGASAAVMLFQKMKPETSVGEYLKCIFLRAAILVPILIPLIAMEIILPLFGSGPVYQSINRHRANICIKNGWMSLLHIQNNSSPLEICVSSTWSLAVEWQLFALACVLVYIYKRNYRLGIKLNILIVLYGIFHVNMSFWQKDIMPHMVMNTKGLSDVLYRAEQYYTATLSHVWSYFFGILSIVILTGDYESKIKKILPWVKTLANTLLTLLAFSPSLWNCFGMQIEPITSSIYVFINKLILGLWCISRFLPHRWQFRRALAQSKSIDMYIHPEECYTDQLSTSNNNSQSLDKTDINKESQHSGIRKHDPLTIILRFSRNAYFVHSVVYAWYFSRLRSTIPVSAFSFTIQMISLIGLTYFFGFIFHILVVGPIERINYISSKKKTKAKTHSS